MQIEVPNMTIEALQGSIVALQKLLDEQKRLAGRAEEAEANAQRDLIVARQAVATTDAFLQFYAQLLLVKQQMLDAAAEAEAANAK